MPGEYDGDIKLSVSLTPGDVKKQSAALEQELGKIFNKISGKKATTEIKKIQAAASKVRDELANAYSVLESMEGATVPTKQFKELSESVTAAKKELANLQKYTDSDKWKGTPVETYNNALQSLSEYNAKLEEVNKKIQDIRNLDNFDPNSKYYNQELQYQSAVEKAVAKAQADVDKLKNSADVINFNNAVESMKRLEEHIRTSESELINMRNNGQDIQPIESSEEYANQTRVVNDLNNKLLLLIERLKGTKSAQKEAGNSTKSTSDKFKSFTSRIKKLASSIQKLKTRLQGLGRNNKTLDNLSFGLRRLLAYGIGIGSLVALFNRLRGAISEGLGNLEKYSPEFKATMDSFRNSLTSLKNSFGAAFAPIASAVIPALNALISTVNAAITAIGKLIALLMGRKTFTKAVDGFNAVGGAAGGAAGAAQELQKTIAGFDDVEILKDDDKSGGGGGGGGGADFSGMFEEVPIESEFTKLVDMIKDAWAKADFTEIGQLIGKKLKGALESIPWDEIKATTFKVAKSVATLLNGFLETPGLFDTIGVTLGEAFNTALIGLNTFAKSFHWDSLGLAISDSINGFFRTAKPKLAASTFSNWAKGILETIYTSLENINWRQIGQWIKEFLVNVDWSGIVSGIAEVIGSAIGGAASLIVGVFKDIPGKIKSYFETHIEEAKASGETILDGILDGIGDALLNIGTWIEDNIVTPFIGGLVKAFTGQEGDAEEIGKNVMEKLKSGVSDGFDTLIEFLADMKLTIQQKFIDIANGAITAINDMIGLITSKLSGTKFGNWIAEKLGIESLEEIKIPLIADVKPSPEKIQKDVAKGIERQGKRTPAKIRSTAEVTKTEDKRPVNERKMDAAADFHTSIDNIPASKKTLNGYTGTLINSKDNIDKKKKELNNYLGILTDSKDSIKKEKRISGYTGDVTNYKDNITKTKQIGGYTGTIINTEDNVAASKKKLDGILGIITNDKDNITKTKQLKDYTGVLTAARDNISNKILKNFTGVLSSSRDSISNKTLTGYSARLDSWTKNFVNAWITGYNARVDDWSDNISVWSKVIGGFTAVVDVVKNVKQQITNIWNSVFGAVGGVIKNGLFSNIPQYAGGTTNAGKAHGTMFIAGEAGPEIVGHIGGRTEILNKSQLASTMHSAIISALTPLVSAIDNIFTNFTVGMNMFVNELLTSLTPPLLVALDPTVIDSLTSNFDNMLPAVVSGQIIPYTTKLTSLEDRVNSIYDRDLVTNEELRKMLNDVINAVNKVQFYIGDEQISRHANAGAQKIDRRYNPVSQGGY